MLANSEDIIANVKIYCSSDRLIYRIYPFNLGENRSSVSRSKKENETSEKKKKINAYNKILKLLGYGLCNEWKYFFTGTIDPKKYESDNFDIVSKLISAEFRKMKKIDSSVKYCFILEKHKNGNYHAHGFCNVPDKFVNIFPKYVDKCGKVAVPSKSKFIQWGIYQKYYSLGINTISPKKSKKSVSDYCAKYIIKNIECGDYAAKSVFKSHDLMSFHIEYGKYAGYSFKSLQSINGSELGLNDINEYEVKQLGYKIKQIVIDL